MAIMDMHRECRMVKATHIRITMMLRWDSSNMCLNHRIPCKVQRQRLTGLGTEVTTAIQTAMEDLPSLQQTATQVDMMVQEKTHRGVDMTEINIPFISIISR